MARQLNTSHALYGNLKSLVGVEDDGATVRDFKVPTRTCTLSGTIGWGTYGYHIQTGNSGAAATGVLLNPAVSFGTTSAGGMLNSTTIVVLNDINSGGGGDIRAFLASSTANTTRPRLACIIEGQIAASHGYTVGHSLLEPGTTNHIGAGALMVAVTRQGETACNLSLNGVSVKTGTSLGFNNDANNYDFIGGYPNGGYGYRHVQAVWVATFDKVLSDAEILDLYNSLGANNTFGLVEPSAGAPVSFTGPVNDISVAVNTSVNVNFSSYFAGTNTPFTYSIFSGTLPATVTLNSTTGVLSGTPTQPYSATSIVVRATDANLATANTNTFSFQVTDAVTNTAPNFVGPNIADMSVVINVAMTSVGIASKFSDAESSVSYSKTGATWPAGVLLDSATGVISGTPTTLGTVTGLTVTATDTGGLTVASNPFSITVTSPPTASTVTVTDPLKNNTGTTLANVSGIRIAVISADLLAPVMIESAFSTDATGKLEPITNASIVSGQSYHVVVKLPDGGIGVSAPIVAA